MKLTNVLGKKIAQTRSWNRSVNRSASGGKQAKMEKKKQAKN